MAEIGQSRTKPWPKSELTKNGSRPFQIDWGNLRVMITKNPKSHNKIDVMKDIDVVPSNVQSARQRALLYVFETMKL